MALTYSRQFWEGADCSSPGEGGIYGSSAWGVCSPLPSLARLLSWAQPSAPYLALNDLPVRGQAWPQHIFPVSVRASSSLPNRGRGLELPTSGLDFTSWGCTMKRSPPEMTSFHTLSFGGLWGGVGKNEATCGLGLPL